MSPTMFTPDHPCYRLDHLADGGNFGKQDHFIYFKKSGGELHGNISTDTIIYLEEPKKGGLLHFDPPVRTSRDLWFGFQSSLPQTFNADSHFFSPRTLQRWIPGLEYDKKGEVILGNPKKRGGAHHQAKNLYMKRPEAFWDG